MAVVGHAKVTATAYAQDRETKERAVMFAESAVRNGLGLEADILSDASILKLKAQIERDFLVAILSAEGKR